MKHDRSPHRAVPALILMLACTVCAMPARARETARPPERAGAIPPARPEAREPPGSWTAGTAPGAACTRARHKLWQAGEGWIVKAITTCR
ncbi:hypothetical protein [uncultured Methylobacterium sp.]|uniref:hypothetical protein n=1 Tax=uncultured Methylobacterium sp. TaxID=157278 RepID=UPI0035CC0DCC